MRTKPIDAEDDAERRGRSGSSRSAMRHQSRSLTSRSASARMISDVACEPELPPELMMSGMNSASTTALRDLALEVLHRGRREHLAEEERARASPRAS